MEGSQLVESQSPGGYLGTQMSHAGKLLIASPILRDPNFLRTVVYLCAHDENGALGVILNRPNPMPLDEIMPRWAMVAAEPSALFAGGPVDQESAIGLGWVTGGDPGDGSMVFVEDPVAMLDLNSDADETSERLGALRIYRGYAGWDAYQLEEELAEGAWHVATATPSDVFTISPNRLWQEVVKRQRGDVAMWATFSEEPELN